MPQKHVDARNLGIFDEIKVMEFVPRNQAGASR